MHKNIIAPSERSSTHCVFRTYHVCGPENLDGMCTMIFFSMKMLSGQQSHFTLETCFPHFLGSLLSVFMMGAIQKLSCLVNPNRILFFTWTTGTIWVSGAINPRWERFSFWNIYTSFSTIYTSMALNIVFWWRRWWLFY